ncbi:MAG: transporter related protein [Hydrocarboniphaga sp.]|uniref:ABC transporter ATP-binding protein n=1 Tax=Hydrocarboniphaga sp. TaxID=2033016 RepID=UPI00260E7B1E|nr:ABC transporter ATP-binding protein [Hydrocarboniphaga sp.]MDB5968155.1 transporter related protein [Hydrocarboniphaga sp.]
MNPTPTPPPTPTVTPLRSSGLRVPLFWRFSGLISPRRNFAVALCVVFASLADGFGIATLLPLISVLGDGTGKTSPMSRAILDLLQTLHVPTNPALLLCIVVGGVLTKGALMIVALRQIGGAVADVAAKLRIGLVEALLRARWSYYVRQPVGRFSNALGAEANAAGDAYNAAMQMLSQLVQAVVYLSIAALVSWRLALFTLLVSGIMLGSLNRFLLAAKRSAKLQQKLLRSILGRLTDVLIGIKPMKAMSRQARFALLFDRDLKQVRKASRRQVFSKNVNKALQEPILAICLSLGIFVALRVLELPIGEVIVMSLLLAKTVLVTGKAQQELQNFYANQHALKSVREAVNESTAAREETYGGGTPTLERGIEFRNVSFGYDERATLRNLDLQIGAGELIALTGPSGAGKTTLVDLLLGFHRPQKGEVWIDGVPMADLDLMQWRSLIGYVPQELILFHDSIAANITLGEPRFSDEDVERALQAAGALDFVRSLPQGTATIAGERGSALSGGQRQRIALARALVHEPRLLILDEATSALDPETETLIIDNVARLVRDRGMTVLSVTHHPAWLKLASRVLRLESGSTSAPLIDIATNH